MGLLLPWLPANHLGSYDPLICSGMQQKAASSSLTSKRMVHCLLLAVYKPPDLS